MTFWAILVGFVALLISAMVGYGVGAADGYANGFKVGCEHERLKAVYKLEPEEGVQGDR